MQTSEEIGKFRRKYFPCCVFCGSAAKTDEHLLPDWLRRALPEGPGDTLDVMGRSDSEDWSLSKANGGVNSQRMRGVCGPCNQHWMSVIQTSTRPILEPLAVDGKWWAFSDAERRQLMIWLTMTTIVYDSMDSNSSGVSQSERALLHAKQAPLDNWWAWIGRRRDAASDRFLLHTGFRSRIDGPVDAQMTMLGVGKVVLQIFSGKLTHPMDALWVAQRMRQRVFWPAVDPMIDVPPPGITTQRATNACIDFTDLVTTSSPKRLLLYQRVGGAVFHDPDARPGRPAAVIPAPYRAGL